MRIKNVKNVFTSVLEIVTESVIETVTEESKVGKRCSTMRVL